MKKAGASAIGMLLAVSVVVHSMPPPGSAVVSLPFSPIAPGIWKATLGTPEGLTLLKAAGVSPDMEALRAMPEAPFPMATGEIEARLSDGKIERGERTWTRLAVDRDARGEWKGTVTPDPQAVALLRRDVDPHDRSLRSNAVDRVGSGLTS